MSSVVVNIAIIDSGRILLTRREDFEVWCLPGGGVDEGESLAQGALREAREETGLEVRLTRLVGVYSRTGRGISDGHVVLFAAQPVGGLLVPQPGEVVEIGYFSSHSLPQDLIAWHRQRVLDALNGLGGGVAWNQGYSWPFDPVLSQQEIYTLRDRSGLSRSDFYHQYFDPISSAIENLEVGDDGTSK